MGHLGLMPSPIFHGIRDTSLNRANLAVHCVATLEESRYSLNHILVNGTGTVSTDGHILAEVSYPTVDGKPQEIDKEQARFLERKDAIEAFRACKKGSSAIAADDELLVLNRTAESRFKFSQEAETFPRYELVIPTEEPNAKVRLDAKLLAEIVKIALELHKPNAGDYAGLAPIDISVYEEGHAVRIDATNDDGQTLRAVLMPLK